VWVYLGMNEMPLGVREIIRKNQRNPLMTNEMNLYRAEFREEEVRMGERWVFL
jgi:hypothetical protein